MFNSSGTSQSAEQQTSNATGLNSISTGRNSTVFRNVFGDKNLAKNDFTKPAIVIVAGLLGFVWLTRKGRK